MGADSRRAARRQAVFLLYQHDVTGQSLQDLTEAAERESGSALDPYTGAVVDGVLSHIDAIDGHINAVSQGWSIDRIAPLERSILRVATHEISQRDDVPAAVAIDEAVRLAKRYCQSEAGPFVNGVLGAVAREGADSD